MPVNKLAGGPQSSSEDLYTKIALDNKLITRFQVRQACKEQEDLTEGGTALDLGNVMVRLGFLTERQHQSVLNACRYREQRDYDKRFARQVMRMNLLEQGAIERALERQKVDYGQNGTVVPLADGLADAGDLTQEQIESVHKGIQERDRARTGGRGIAKGAAPQRPLAVSGPTPVLDRGDVKRAPTEDDADLDDEDLDDVDLDDEDDLDGLDDLDDLDDADLDDADLDDLDDADLDDLDLDDADLDDLDDADLDDADLDDDDLDDGDLAGLSDLDDGDLDDGALDDDMEDALGSAAPAATAPAEPSDLADLNLDDLDEADLDAVGLDEGGEDEEDLAHTTSELDSDVELDEEDLKALDEMGSEEELEEAAGWAAEAFDPRPMNKRPPSERMPAQAVSARPPSVPTPPAPPARPAPPQVAGKAGGIPGGDVFDENLSDIAKTDTAERESAPKDLTDFGPVNIEPLVESDMDLDVPVPGESRGRPSPPSPPLSPAIDDEPSEERRALIESAVTDAVKRALSSSGSEVGGVIEPEPEPEPSAPALDLEDPRVRQAFERAMESAWATFKRELEG